MSKYHHQVDPSLFRIISPLVNSFSLAFGGSYYAYDPSGHIRNRLPLHDNKCPNVASHKWGILALNLWPSWALPFWVSLGSLFYSHPRTSGGEGGRKRVRPYHG